MARNIDDIISELSPEEGEMVEVRTAQLIAEEMTLRQLRQARKLTQQRLAKSLRMGQEGISKLEKRSDLLISTLRSYVMGMGGSLSLVVEFPDRKPVIICGIGDESIGESHRAVPNSTSPLHTRSRGRVALRS